MFIFQFVRNAIEIVVNVSGHDLCIALRLGDVGVPEHFTDMLDGYAMPEHPCGEGVTRHVAVQWSLNTASHSECLQA